MVRIILSLLCLVGGIIGVYLLYVTSRLAVFWLRGGRFEDLGFKRIGPRQEDTETGRYDGETDA